jgi:23S rRNA pseudouridine1911/1915/1917 synthase
LIVDEKDKGRKLRDYLKNEAEFSSRLIRGAARDGRISVNGKVVTLRYAVMPGDRIEFDVSKDESQDIAPENIPLDIVYEDADIIVVNKKPFMVVHPTRSYQSGTLANGLLYYFREKGEDCIVRLVSRLDMNTSGLILVAKNQFAHMALARDMHREGFDKVYYAVVHGNMEKSEGTIDEPIYKPDEAGIKRVIDEKGQRSVTHYRVVESFRDGDLVELQLETGRTHQIRVHLAHMGNPLFGDALYNTGDEFGNMDEDYIGRQALHACRLRFPHPRTGEMLTLEAGIPEDMEKLMEKLRSR